MFDPELNAFRSKIDVVDSQLIRLLGERFRITLEIGFYKAANGMPPTDLVRQHAQIDRLRELARSEGLDPDFCERFVHLVMDEVISNHINIARGVIRRDPDPTV